MVYLLIFLVVALVIGPVIWIRPSPREKQQQRLRNFAKQLGLQVHMRPIPHPRDDAERKFDANIMAYIRPWTELERKKTLPRNFIMGKSPGEEAWALYRTKNMLHENDIQGLPVSSQILEVNAEGVILYWRESGNEDRVQALANALEGVAQKLLNGVS